MIDLCQFQERAAICEFDGGMTRFDAETAAARERGLERWQAMQEIKDAQRQRPSGRDGRHADQMGRGRDANGLPTMQRQSKEETRSVPVGQPEGGRDRDPLLALQPC